MVKHPYLLSHIHTEKDAPNKRPGQGGITEKLGASWNVTSPATNPTWTALGANPGLAAENLATESLSYGTT
jgi:hypothetical protein